MYIHAFCSYMPSLCTRWGVAELLGTARARLGLNQASPGHRLTYLCSEATCQAGEAAVARPGANCAAPGAFTDRWVGLEGIEPPSGSAAQALRLLYCGEGQGAV